MGTVILLVAGGYAISEVKYRLLFSSAATLISVAGTYSLRHQVSLAGLDPPCLSSCTHACIKKIDMRVYYVYYIMSCACTPLLMSLTPAAARGAGVLPARDRVPPRQPAAGRERHRSADGCLLHRSVLAWSLELGSLRAVVLFVDIHVVTSG